jgi:hypothetical protein
MAASARTISGSRFLRPELSRFFNQVARPRSRKSRFVKGTVALMPMPDIYSSRFLMKPLTPPVEAATTPPARHHSRFLPPKVLSRFIHQVAQAPPRIISRFLKGIAALMPSMPRIFSSRFFTKPQTPPRNLSPHWPRGKPQGPDH